jgi:hypothetical protein
MYKHLVTLSAALVIVMTPAAAFAKTNSALPKAAAKEITSAIEKTRGEVPTTPTVLGASTDSSASVTVTKQLDTAYTTDGKDLTIKPPLGWTSEEDPYYDGSYDLYFDSPDQNATIGVTYVDGQGLSLAQATEQVRKVLCPCGYKINDSGTTRVASRPASYFDTTYHGQVHQSIYLVASGTHLYSITLTTPLSVWKQFQPIMTKSLKSIRIND